MKNIKAPVNCIISLVPKNKSKKDNYLHFQLIHFFCIADAQEVKIFIIQGVMVKYWEKAMI